MNFYGKVVEKNIINQKIKIIRILVVIIMVLSSLLIISLNTMNTTATAILSIQINPSDTSSKMIFPNGPSVTYKIDITNYGQGGNINITNSTPPTGWTALLDQNLVYLDGSGGTTTVTLTVDCPNTATSISEEGEYAMIAVIANEVGAAPGNAKQIMTTTTLGQEYGLSLTNKTGDSHTKSPDEYGKVEYDLTVNNTGNGKDYITWSTENEPGSAVINPGYIEAFSEKDFNLRISDMPDNISKGVHYIKIIAYSENTSYSAEFYVEIYIPPVYKLILNLNESKASKEVKPGESLNFNFILTNKGDTDDDIKVQTSFKTSAIDWTLLLNTQPDFSIKVNETKDIQIEVITPLDQNHPFNMPIYINTSSKNNVNIYQNITVIAKIKQIGKIRLDIPLFKSLNFTTMSVSFPITVYNEGNGEDTFEFNVFGNFPTGELWTYEFNPPLVTLGSKDKSNDYAKVHFNVTGPDEAHYGNFNLSIG